MFNRILISAVASLGIVLAIGAGAPATAQDSPLPPDGFLNPPIYANIIDINPIPAPASIEPNQPPAAAPQPEQEHQVLRDDTDADLSAGGRR